MDQNSSSGTIVDGVALLSPLVFLGGLALAGGGFDLTGRHVASIAAWIAVAALAVSDQGRRAEYGAQFKLFAFLLLGFAALSGLSVLWSSSIHNSLVESARVIGYLGFFLLGYLVCGNLRSRRLFTWGLLLALAFILALSLGHRLFPGTGTPSNLITVRLSFPLGYWNANGLLFGFAIVGFAWASRECRHKTLRLLWVAAIPAAAAGLFLTYSRGGALAGLIGLITIFFLSRDRIWISSAVATGLVCSVPVIKVIHSNPAIADNLGGAGAPAQGREVLFVLLIAMLAAGFIFWALTSLASRLPRATSRVLSTSRDRRFLFGAAAVLASVIGILMIAFGGHVWEQFSGSHIYFPTNPEAHFTQLSGAGRYQFNQVAVNTFTDHPLIGTGAGTYQFEWAALRPIDLVAKDAHSWYLEAFSDLGIGGGLLVLALAATAIWMCVTTWRRSPASARGVSTLIITCIVVLLVAFGIDWFWELGATAAFLMLVCGWLAAASGGPPERRVVARRNHWVLVLAAWAAVVLLAIPVVADRSMAESIGATKDGRLVQAVRSAQTASTFAPWWARPHMQLGVLAQHVGLERRAIDEFTRAIELEPDNWQTWFLRSRAEQEFGRRTAAESDLENARRRNPREPKLQPQPAAASQD